MGIVRKRIGEILLEARSISPEALERALQAQVGSGKRLGAVMVEMGILTELQVTIALGLQFMLPVVNVGEYLANVDAINALPRALLERLKALPLEFQNDGRVLLVAISDPLDVTTQDMLRMASHLELRFALAPAEEILEVLSSGKSAPHTAQPPASGAVIASEPRGGAIVLGAPPAAASSAVIASEPRGGAIVLGAPPAAEPGAVIASEPRGEAPAQSPQPASSVVAEPGEGGALVEGSPIELEAPNETRVGVAPAAGDIPVEPPRPDPAHPASGAVIIPESSGGKPSFAAENVPEKSIIPSFASLHAAQPKLGDILVQAGAIQETQLLRALQVQKSSGKRLGEILVSEGIITEVRVAEALSMQLRLPMFTLTRYRPMPAAIKLVPRNVAERLELIPLSIVDGDLLLIAMANPLDLLAQDEVRMLTGRDLKVGITTPTEIKKNLDRLYNLQDNLEDAIVEVDGDHDIQSELDFDAKSDEAPIIQLVSNLMQQAAREGASDIHVEVYEKTARVRFRVDGQLYTAFEYPVALHPAVSARLKIMSGMDIAEKRKPQDGRILIRMDGRRIDLRVSVLPTMNGEKVVLRILDQESANVGLERLGLEPDDMEKIEMFCGLPWGIMLVTGPTGSGKSTTLYSMLQRINQPDVNIITVEDPVEFTVAGINQVHVNEKAGLTFESALRSILRQDPDKVMVGEIRDQKTAQIAIRAALTGHFVLSTLHTNDAPSAATRMIDMGVASFLVSASLAGVVAQRLVRRLCASCREEYEMTSHMCEMLHVPEGTRAFRPKGCNECRNGYKGRRGIYEIMIVDDDLRRMILDGVSNIQLRAEAIARGMKTLRQSGVNAALAGHTSIEEVFSTTL